MEGKSHMSNHIIRIDPYRGGDTAVITEVLHGDMWMGADDLGEPIGPALYAIVSVADDGAAAIVDNGYRTADEAKAAWPEAVLPAELL